MCMACRGWRPTGRATRFRCTEATDLPDQVSETGETVGLEELDRDEKILEIFGGANEVLQWVIARQLISRDSTG